MATEFNGVFKSALALLLVAAGVSPAVEPSVSPGGLFRGLSNNILPVSSAESDGRMPSSTAGETPAATNLVIGLLLPENEPLSLSVRQGVELGVENYQGSRGAAARLVIRGAVGQWGADGVEAARMVTDDGAAGLIAPPSGGASHLALQIAGRTAVPVISLCGDSSVTRTGVPWTASVTPGTLDEAKTIFCASPGLNQWAAYVPEGRRGREITSDLKAAARDSGVFFQGPIEVKWPVLNLSELCDPARTDGLQGILLWLDPLPAATMVRRLREAGFHGKLAGPGWLNCKEFETAAGSGLEAFMIVSPAGAKSNETRLADFALAFRTHFGREPDAMAAMSYDAAQLLLELLCRAGDRPPRELFPIEFSTPGVTGVLRFDEFGKRQLELEPQEGQGGHFSCATRS